MAMMKLLIPILSIIFVSQGLVIHEDSNFRVAHRNDSDWGLPNVIPGSTHNPGLKNLTGPLAGGLDAWPPLPITFDIGHQLSIIIKLLGPITAPTQKTEILTNIDDVYCAIEAEGDASTIVPKAYARSSGIVTTFFGSKPDADLRRSQAAQVVSAVWSFSLSYDPREILLAEIELVDKPIATFALRFSEAGR